MAAFILTRNLKLRVDANLTANAKYNLERLDLLGATFIVDTTDSLNIRSKSDITLEPNSADLSGSGVGGTISIGSSGHVISAFNVFASATNISFPVGLLDQAMGGNKYLRLQYKSDINGSVDTTADRTLSLDLEGSNRNIVLSGDLSLFGNNPLVLNTTGNTSVILPLTGTLATLSGSETLTNKTIDAASNTILNIINANISSSAAIQYSKLNLTNSIVNSDLSSSISLDGSKVNPAFGNQLISTSNNLEFDHAGHSTTIRPAQSGQSTDLTFTLPVDAGTSGYSLSTDGSGNLSWIPTAGSGTVTSVGLTADPVFTVTGSPVTSAGTINLALASQAGNTVLAGPTSGGPAVPTFRGLVAADIQIAGYRAMSASWIIADGTTKTVTHNWGSQKIQVEVLDNSNGYATINMSSVQRPTINTVVITSTDVPASTWTILLKEIP